MRRFYEVTQFEPGLEPLAARLAAWDRAYARLEQRPEGLVRSLTDVPNQYSVLIAANDGNRVGDVRLRLGDVRLRSARGK